MNWSSGQPSSTAAWTWASCWCAPPGPRHVAKRAPVSVAIVGEPGELLMHAHGRTRHALVTFEGQPDAVALLQSAEVGL